MKKAIGAFRPLIRGFFFYDSAVGHIHMFQSLSVPLFGDSFFICSSHE